MSDTLRLFFALWPGAELRDVLATCMTEVTHFPCRPMLPGNLHVTLAFLGSVPASRVAELVTLIQPLKFTQCDLIFDRVCIWEQARVLVLTASKVPESLQRLVTTLQTRLLEARLHVDARPYRPHVTLARDVRQPASDQATTPVIWSASDFVLVESIATEQGVQYQVLATFGG